MPLEGLNSIIGRSVVINYSNQSIWACANIVFDAIQMNGTLVQAMATFSRTSIQGYVKLVSIQNQTCGFVIKGLVHLTSLLYDDCLIEPSSE